MMFVVDQNVPGESCSYLVDTDNMNVEVSDKELMNFTFYFHKVGQGT